MEACKFIYIYISAFWLHICCDCCHADSQTYFSFPLMRSHCGLARTNLVRVLWNPNFQHFFWLLLICECWMFCSTNLPGPFQWHAKKEKKKQIIVKEKTSTRRMHQSIKWAHLQRSRIVNVRRNNKLKQNVTFKCPLRMNSVPEIKLIRHACVSKREEEWNE